ncbi:MAG: hypothetical protein Q8O43_05035 [Dehalococcoidia bacterium]|nr:hypothetical protein [Dehalococcoidia bacterium]
MFKRWQLSSIEIVLVIVLLAGAIVSFSVFRMNGETEREKTRLEARVRAADLNLKDLEQLTSSSQRSTGKTLPNEAAALAVTNQFLQNAKSANIAITSWDFEYTTVALEARKYAAIKHSVNVQGTTEALISFIEALSHTSVVPAVKKIVITKVEEKENVWQMKLELLIYYSQG